MSLILKNLSCSIKTSFIGSTKIDLIVGDGIRTKYKRCEKVCVCFGISLLLYGINSVDYTDDLINDIL